MARTTLMLLALGAALNLSGGSTVGDVATSAADGSLPELGQVELIMTEYTQSIAATCVPIGNGNGSHRLEWSFTAANISGVPGGVSINGAVSGDVTIGSTGPTVTADNGTNNGSCSSDAARNFVGTVTGTLDNGDTYNVTLTGVPAV